RFFRRRPTPTTGEQNSKITGASRHLWNTYWFLRRNRTSNNFAGSRKASGFSRSPAALKVLSTSHPSAAGFHLPKFTKRWSSGLSQNRPSGKCILKGSLEIYGQEASSYTASFHSDNAP